MSRAPSAGSLFAGIGGFDLGFERAGFALAWHAEIDKAASAVLRYRWPDVPNLGDVTKIHAEGYLDKIVRTFYPPSDGVAYTPEEAEMAGHLKKLTPEQADECVRMYDAGLSLAPIADYFHVSRQAMWDLLRRRTTLRGQRREGSENHFFRGGSKADDHAQNILEAAIKAGIVTRKGQCETCGSSGFMRDGRSSIQAHHSDYNKPLSVSWLCQKCHHKWHKGHNPIEKEVPREAAAVDVIVGGFPL